MKHSEALRSNFRLWTVAVLSLFGAGFANDQPTAIDAAKSVITVHVYKTGVLSVFGHDHEIAAPISRGVVDVQKRMVELHVKTEAMRVQDAKVSDKDREEIQATMLGPEVLDAKTYNEVSFTSTNTEAEGTSAWKVTGNLTLHGQTEPVSIEVREQAGHYIGAARVDITSFGIKPVKVAGGTIRVKSEVKIEFDVQLVR